MPTNEPPEPEPSGRTGLGHWLKKRPFITLGLAIMASLIIGWAVGTWSTCGPRCGFDADLFGAWGAWVGGLATTGAFAFTAHELVSSRRREEKEDNLRAEEVLTRARNVQAHLYSQWQPIHSTFRKPSSDAKAEVSLIVRNFSPSPITDVRALFGAERREIFREAQINQKDASGKGMNDVVSHAFTPEELDLKYDPNTLYVAVEDIPFAVEFTMEGHRFRIKEEEVSLIHG